TDAPLSASSVARITTDVDFPTAPFGLAVAIPWGFESPFRTNLERLKAALAAERASVEWTPEPAVHVCRAAAISLPLEQPETGGVNHRRDRQVACAASASRALWRAHQPLHCANAGLEIRSLARKSPLTNSASCSRWPSVPSRLGRTSCSKHRA